MVHRLLVLSLFSFAAHAQPSLPFYSFAGSERKVSFTHDIETDLKGVDQIQSLGAVGRSNLLKFTIRPLMKFLFGPLTHRKIGGVQRNDMITVRWDQARLSSRGRVVLPIDYKATWILENSIAEKGEFTIPVPHSFDYMFTDNWRNCTDPWPEHAVESMFWYYWDPARPGCDHRKGEHYEEVRVLIGQETPPARRSFPEYDRLVRTENGIKMIKMTFAFGYAEDVRDPHPERDQDVGAAEYRSFLYMMGARLPHLAAKPIHLREYKDAKISDRIIGYRFSGQMEGRALEIEVVVAAGIDQIYLFAHSFAHRHDSVFAWMGHSRVGSGFDAALFRRILESEPERYTISADYQLVYWGGCNSYSYYSLPFFEFKAEAFPETDPNGTRGLDLLVHGLPSYFSLNSLNAETLLAAMLGYPPRMSYQQLVRAIEQNGNQAGALLLAAVLGDEDNEN